MALEVERDADSSLILDSRYFPILITRWIGKPTRPLAEHYFRWHDAMLERADFEETRVVHVTDATRAKQPDPPVRKYVGEASNERIRHNEVAINSYIALESAMVRGVLTVIGWVMGDNRSKMTTTPSLKSALELALVDLDRNKIARPRGLDASRYDQQSMSLAAAS